MAITGSSFNIEHGFTGDNGDRTPISIKPFNSVNLEDEKDILDWVQTAAKELADYYSPYRQLYKDNIAMYVSGAMEKTTAWNGQYLERSRASNITRTNLIRPIVESHVSRLTSTRAAVSVLPVHTHEYNDLIAAKNATSLIQASFLDRKCDDKFEKAARTMLVCGSAYMAVEWDNTIGPPLSQIDEGIPVIDDEGNPRLDEDDKPIMIRPDLRLGDVNYKLLRPDQVLEQPGCWGESVDWVIRLDMVDVYRLREKYPTVAHLINSSDSADDKFQNMTIHKTAEKQALVYTFYHRATPSLPNGQQIVITEDVLLEQSDLPYPTLNKYGMLPLARLDDMLVPGYDLPLPLSVMEAGKPYQHLHNRVNSNILRNLSLQAPKWIVNSGSGVRMSHLNNMSNVVQYKGDASMRPMLDSPKTTPNEMFNYRQQLQQELQVSTGSSHILNEPPPNTRAATMLEHQEEQEFKRAEPLIKHMNNFQADIARIAVAIMADKYDDSDERSIKLSGHGGASSLIRLKVADLIGPFDVKFERTSALPESKQGRLNEASRMFQLGLIDATQYKQLIGYNADPELADAKTKANDKQMLEIDLMVRGHEIESPLEFEDHVEHLRVLYPLIQSVEFAEMPDQTKQKIVSHAMAHEMFAWQKSQVSMAYAVRVAEHVQFLFFSALPEAMPVGVNNAPTPAEGLIAERLKTPGLVQPGKSLIEPPGPSNPEAV